MERDLRKWRRTEIFSHQCHQRYRGRCAICRKGIRVLYFGLKKGDIIFLEGDLGAGKTTFTKGLAEAFGVKAQQVVSPTFVIMNHYDAKLPIYHFDLYRLKSNAELLDIGFEDYLIGTNYVFIEWPELSMTFITSAIKVEIKFENNIRYIYAQLIKTS